MKSLTASGIDAWRPSRTDMQRIPRSKATREREVSIMPTFGFARARHLPEISRVKIATFVSHADELQATYPCYSTTLKRPQRDRSGWSSDLAALAGIRGKHASGDVLRIQTLPIDRCRFRIANLLM